MPFFKDFDHALESVQVLNRREGAEREDQGWVGSWELEKD
jgi:hypothetical protein